MTLKVGVLSDTHLHRVTDDFKKIYDRYLSDADIVLHAGDFVSPEVVLFLDNGAFHGVRGNMDPYDIQVLLPNKKVIQVASYRIGLIHGWGSSAGLEERIRPEFPDADVIVYGHSHQPVSHSKNGVFFFNPGTATGFAYKKEHSLGILEFGDSIKGRIIPIPERAEDR
jgi:putative phosphoesterase